MKVATIGEQFLPLVNSLVGEQPEFALHRRWGAAARRIFGLHHQRFVLQQQDPIRLDRDFEALCEIFSSSAFNEVVVPGRTMHVLGYEDGTTPASDELRGWQQPSLWEYEVTIGQWWLRRHVTHRELHRLSFREQDYLLSFWFLVQ